MLNLARADAALASAVDRLASLPADTTRDINAVQILKAELVSARRALGQTIARMTAEPGQTNLHHHAGLAADDLQRFAAVFDYALDAILIADDGARYVSVNAAACELLGYTREELLELGVSDITPELQRELVPHAWQEFLKCGTMTGEYSVRTRSGETIAVEFRAVANILPGEHLSVLRDVSRLRDTQERNQAQQHNQRQQALSALYEVLDILVAVKLDASSPPGWRSLLTNVRSDTIAGEVGRAMRDVRSAIDALQGAPVSATPEWQTAAQRDE
ncbi:MAG: PAS domain S-box protein [Pseudomonadota bacterium]|nr:PAS domain S-box protein [Pseudomonadota bacterium]